MRKIKGYKKTKENFIHKIITREEEITPEAVSNDITTENKAQETLPEVSNCFALVVVRNLPWYKKFIRNIRNFIVIYKWRKAR